MLIWRKLRDLASILGRFLCKENGQDSRVTWNMMTTKPRAGTMRTKGFISWDMYA